MHLDRNLEAYLVNENVEIADALRKLSDTKKRIVFTVDNYFRLTGSLTDGDFRRWLLSQSDLNLKVPVGKVANRNVISALDSDDYSRIAEHLSSRVQCIPVVDKERRVVSIASIKAAEITFGSKSVNEESPVFVVAEIGNNHNGSLDLAKKLVDLAKESGADCAKFQMRDLQSLYRNSGDASDDSEDLGSQYVLDLLNRFQLQDQEFEDLFEHTRRQGLIVLCTPFDKVSADRLERLGVEGFKIASADLTNHDFLRYVARKGRPMIVSTGMATEQEIYDAIQVLKAVSANYILLHCNSTYPAPFKDINLNYMKRLKEAGDCIIGYSGHERGISVAIAAVSLGAKVIEKHFTIDRAMEGNDHRVSLLPGEFRDMVDGIRQVEQSLGVAKPRTLSQGEMMNRETLAKSVVAAVDIEVGDIIDDEMLEIKSPGKGLAPYRKKELIGKAVTRAMRAGDFFFSSDLDSSGVQPRNYRFEMPFGIPVRYHDFKGLVSKSNFDMLEFHLSYKDLDVDLGRYFDQPCDIGFAVHAPELFSGDHTLDLCSPDEEYRKRSIHELQRVIDITRQLKGFFPATARPVIVCNVGGFTSSGFLSDSDKSDRYRILEDSLERLDSVGVEIIPQTMPPFPWHFGGQQYHNLFVSSGDIVDFCTRTGMRICLDVSHSKLACNYYQWEFSSFVEAAAPYAAHIHIADADGSDGEGLQIGDGIINFRNLISQLNTLCPSATWIPEIWQGHKNSGEGFWLALSRLEDFWQNV